MFGAFRVPAGSGRHRKFATKMHYAMLAIAVLVTIGISTLLEKRTAAASQPAETGKPAVTIKMVDVPAVFQPGTVTIKIGDTVEWVNVGTEVHHATTDPSMAVNCGDVGSPQGAEPFDSGFLKPGASFKHTFKVAGTYRYACAVHETSGMIGKIVVK
jgi:plastocyanin